MFNFIMKKIHFSQINKSNYAYNNNPTEISKIPISSSLKSNLSTLKQNLIGSDIIIREFNFGTQREIEGIVVYVNGMVNKEVIDSCIIKPLMYDTLRLKNIPLNFNSIDTLIKNVLIVSNAYKVTYFEDLINNLLVGNTILFVNKATEALVINNIEWKHRAIKEPLTENVVRGSREGFTESLQINTTLLRRIIKDSNLCLETIKIGDKTKTEVCLSYLKDIVNDNLINEIKSRLNRIHIDAILESGYIEQFIEDAPFSIFSTVANSERPDKVAARMLDGKVALLIDGTPFVLTVPSLFIESFQSSEDYYSRTFFSSIVRLLRFLSFLISILAPATYVALTIFHQELIPTELLISIAAGHESIPFPAVFETALMLVTFDILREAGIRLPRPVGSSVSIVGALVLGQSAVSAGLISPLMVIVVAITAITSFVVPSQTDSVSILRYILLILAGIAGGYGILLGLITTLVHMASLRSFGTPYLWPLAPLSIEGLKDTFIRMPLWNMKERPKVTAENNLHKTHSDLMPSTKQNNKS